MQDDGHEKQYRGDDCRCPDRDLTPLRIGGMKLAGKRKRYQQSNDQPAVVQSDLNAEDASELYLCLHIASLLSSCHLCPQRARWEGRKGQRSIASYLAELFLVASHAFAF